MDVLAAAGRAGPGFPVATAVIAACSVVAAVAAVWWIVAGLLPSKSDVRAQGVRLEGLEKATDELKPLVAKVEGIRTALSGLDGQGGGLVSDVAEIRRLLTAPANTVRGDDAFAELVASKVAASLDERERQARPGRSSSRRRPGNGTEGGH